MFNKYKLIINIGIIYFGSESLVIWWKENSWEMCWLKYGSEGICDYYKLK